MANSKQAQFLKLYQPVHAQFERFCRARAFGDMPYQDLINDSLLIAFQKMDHLKSDKAFLSYLIGIAIRVLSNARRKLRPKSGVDELVFLNHADPASPIDQKFEVQMLHRALAQLPQLQREALILFEITGYSIKEIMEIQHSGLSAVKQRLARGRKNLTVIVKELMRIPEKVKVDHVHSSNH